MPGFLRRCFLRQAVLLATSGVLVVAAGCTAASPRVTVLGVEQAPRTAEVGRDLLLFVEVVNPSPRDLHLSRLEYRVRAVSWFESAGQVPLTREIGAGESAVVEIPVPVRHADTEHEGTIPYTLDGRLFAVEDHVERSWSVAVRGAIGRNGTRTTPIRVTVLDPE